MPIKHAALKQLRKDRVRAQRNRVVRSALRTITKRLVALLKDQKVAEAKTLLQEVSKKLDRAASKGVIHRNAASRGKSRWHRRLNQLSPASRG